MYNNGKFTKKCLTYANIGYGFSAGFLGLVLSEITNNVERNWWILGTSLLLCVILFILSRGLKNAYLYQDSDPYVRAKIEETIEKLNKIENKEKK